MRTIGCLAIIQRLMIHPPIYDKYRFIRIKSNRRYVKAKQSFALNFQFRVSNRCFESRRSREWTRREKWIRKETCVRERRPAVLCAMGGNKPRKSNGRETNFNYRRLFNDNAGFLLETNIDELSFHSLSRGYSTIQRYSGRRCKLEIYFSNKVEEKTFVRTKDKRTLRSPKKRKQIIIVFVPNFLDGLEKGSRQDTAWGRMCAFEEEWREIDKDCTADCKTCLPSPRSIPR